MSTWREKARPVIAAALRDAEERGLTDAEIRIRIRDAYPFGQRQYFSYKVWLDEVKVQRGLKVSKSAKEAAKREETAGQLRLAIYDSRIAKAVEVLNSDHVPSARERDTRTALSELKRLASQ